MTFGNILFIQEQMLHVAEFPVQISENKEPASAISFEFLFFQSISVVSFV